MNRVDLLTLPTVNLQTERLEKNSAAELVLELYDRERIPLLRYLSFLGIDSETRQEVVQESFLKLHEHLLQGGDRTNLRAWLFRVSHNLARNTQTTYRAKKTDQLDLTTTGDPAAQEMSAEEDLLAKERGARVKRAMERLSAAQRDCLLLRAQGLKYREIAEALKLSVSTVGETVQRGLERLKELL